jgi:hypothetical protein
MRGLIFSIASRPALAPIQQPPPPLKVYRVTIPWGESGLGVRLTAYLYPSSTLRMSGATRVLSPLRIQGVYRYKSTLLHPVIIPKLLPKFQDPLFSANKLWRSHTHNRFYR